MTTDDREGALVDRANYRYEDVARTEMIPFVPASATRVLDVGCGRGGFGAALKAARPEVHVTGIEPDAWAADQARPRNDTVVVGSFPDAVKDTTYDCVVFNDVLEHFEDPWQVLQQARQLVEKGGVVVASIPNVRYWPVLYGLVVAGDFRYADDGVLDRTHLRFFTSVSSQRMFSQAGYEVLTCTPVNLLNPTTLPRWQARALRWLARLSGRRAADLRAQQYAVVARPWESVRAD